jgi:hypothetical protein
MKFGLVSTILVVLARLHLAYGRMADADGSQPRFLG